MDYLHHKFPLNHKNLLLKLVLSIFFFGLAFRLLFFHSLSPQISTVLESPFPEKTTVPEPQDPPVPEHVPQQPHVPEHVPESEDVTESEDQLSHTESEDQVSYTESEDQVSHTDTGE